MKNKILKIFTLLFIFITILNSAIFASTLNLNINADKGQIKKGEEIKVIVSWQNGMQAADFSLIYDTSKFEYISSNLEEVFINNDKEKGEVKTSWFSMNNEDKTEIIYVFKAIKSGKAEFVTRIDGGFATGDLEVPTEYNTQNISVRVVNNPIIYICIFLVISIIVILIIKGGKKSEKSSK